MELNNKRVVVTGGAGFIGSHLVEKLAGTGNDISVIDNLSSGYEENLRNIQGNVKLHRVNVQDDIEEYMEGADVIFHLAANVSVNRSVDEPMYDMDNNIKGTLNVLETARRLDIPKIVYSSSSAVYGDDVAVPIDEQAATKPGSPYGISKYVGEMYCRAYHSLYGIDSTVLRYFNVYGPGQPADSPYSGVIAIFVSKAVLKEPLTVYGDGEQSRDFVGVNDVVSANIAGAMKKDIRGEAFNIGTGSGITINRLADLVEGFSGKLERNYQPFRKGDIKQSIADITRAKEILDYSPTASIEEGLKDLYDSASG